MPEYPKHENLVINDKDTIFVAGWRECTASRGKSLKINENKTGSYFMPCRKLFYENLEANIKKALF